MAAIGDTGVTSRQPTDAEQAVHWARSLFEASLDPLVTISHEGRITDANRATIKVTGQPRERLVGSTFADYFTEPERARACHHQVFAEGIVTDYPLTIRRDDGHLTELLYNASVYKDVRGDVLGMLAAAREVTETNRVIRELEQAKSLLDNIYQRAIKYSIIATDLDNRILTWNEGAKRNYGYTAEEILGRNAESLHTPENLASGVVAATLKIAIDNGMAESEFERLREDGSRFWANVVVTRRDDAAGKPIGYLIMSSDVSESKQATRLLAEARERAEQASQAKSRFLTGITHELRTPLHGMLGYAELLGLEGGLNQSQSARVTAMIAAGEHLLDMINSVLHVSQIEAGRLELHPVVVELSELADACLNVVRPAAEAKKLALRLTSAAPLRLLADPTRLRQVLINLLGNAVKFTSAGSVELRFGPIKDGAAIRLEVVDTGPGIWARHRERLFKTFERLNRRTVADVEGAGVGLALAAGLVHLMDGQIGYLDNPGGGSVFWLELPRGDDVPIAAATAAPGHQAARTGLRVLVVDDDALNRTIASGFLLHGGHHVVCLEDGTAAVEAAAAEDFDVILMDVRMPGMNGLEATRRIRALPAPRGLVPVVAVTAQAFAEQIELCRQAGMASHISKPFKSDVLLAALDAVVSLPPEIAGAGPLPATVPVVTELELPVFDRAVYEDAGSCLTREEAVEYLRTQIERGESLRHALRLPGILLRGNELAETAHLLAGGAATFGFVSLGRAGRRFEFAADSGAVETVRLADQLSAAIEAAAPIMRRELAAMTH